MSLEQLAFLALVVGIVIALGHLYVARQGHRTVEEIATLLRRLVRP